MESGFEQAFQKIQNAFKQFENKSNVQIGQELGLNINLLGPNLSSSTLVNLMYKHVGLDIKKYKKQYNLSDKTVRLQENHIPKESMSFEGIDFHKVVDEQWESSFLRQKFQQTLFLFVVFEYQGETLYYRGLKQWRMHEDILETEVKDFWSKLQIVLKEGVVLNPVQQKTRVVTENNLPSTKDNSVMHVRPKANDSNDKTSLPDGQMITKQCYWLNASFVGKVLSDLSPLRVTNSLENTVEKLTLTDFERLKDALSDEIYTIEQFITFAEELVDDFTLFHITNKLIEELGYRLKPPYILLNNFLDPNTYFEQKILKDKYFVLPENPLYQTEFVKRKLQKMENNYSLLKIDDSTYMTKTALEHAKIDKSEIISFRESVEQFVQENQFFTYKSLKISRFEHITDSYGFESTFYESLLKRPGHLKHLKLCNNIFYIKSKKKVGVTHFFKLMFDNLNTMSLTIDQMLDLFEKKFAVTISYENLQSVLHTGNFKQYYSEDLQKLFYDKKNYLNYIS